MHGAILSAAPRRCPRRLTGSEPRAEYRSGRWVKTPIEVRTTTEEARMAASGEFVEHTTAMAVEEKAKLQKHFSRFDMMFFLICTLVGVDTLGQVSSYGAQGFTWLIFLGIFFFIPYALLIAEIGSAFTEEGGPYIWTKMAFGRFLA